jgi:Protein of unknown function (DUF3112)
MVAIVGGLPTVGVDVPIAAVFLALFVVAAAGHMTILQVNLRKGHKFMMSGLLFGFCMARIVACIMRIVWATRPTNKRAEIAATIFVPAGILILFIINLAFAQRILRAAHPHFGWHKAMARALTVFYVLTVAMLVIAIMATVQSSYTLNENTQRISRDLQILAGSYFITASFLPIPMVIIGLIVPRKTRVEKFGSGRWRSKIGILLITSALVCLGTSFRAGIVYTDPRPFDHPAWYHEKWCFYFFNFTIDIIAIYLYLVLRIDRRFYVPDGSKGPGDYSKGNAGETVEKAVDKEERRGSFSSVGRILTEEEVFDDKEPDSGRVSRDEETSI